MCVFISEKEHLFHICMISSKDSGQWNLSYLLIDLIYITNENNLNIFYGRLVLSTTRLCSDC